MLILWRTRLDKDFSLKIFSLKISCQKWCNGLTTVTRLLLNQQIKNFYLGFFSNPACKERLKKNKYTLLFARYFTYTNKLHNNSLLITDFVSKISSKHRLENLDYYVHVMILLFWSTLVKSSLLSLNPSPNYFFNYSL